VPEGGCCGWFTWAPDETEKGRGEEKREVFGCELGADRWSTVLGATRLTVLLGDAAEEEEPCAAEFDCSPFVLLMLLDQLSTAGPLGKYKLSGGGGDGDEAVRPFTAPEFMPAATLPSGSAGLPLTTVDMLGVVVVVMVEEEVVVVVGAVVD